MAVEELDVAGAGVVFGQGRDRAEEVFAAFGALHVVEDLDRHRGVGGAEAVAFLGNAAEDPLGVADAGDVDDCAPGFWSRSDDQIAQPEQGEGEHDDDPEPAAAGHRFDGDFGHAPIIATGVPGSRNVRARRLTWPLRAITWTYPLSTTWEVSMAHHLTPSELADQLQMKRQEVIGKCVEMGVPIFHGRIDRTLFETSLRSLTAARSASHRPELRLN